MRLFLRRWCHAAAAVSLAILAPQAPSLHAHTHHAEVIGLDNAKQELSALKDIFDNRQRYADMGATLPRGILLVGPPGVGKTHLLRSFAQQAGFKFIYRSGADFDTMFVGQGAQRVKEAFAEARHNQPAILFIDEFDTLGAKRTADATADATINQLLVEMDGFTEYDNVVVVAATNMEDTLDAAVRRSGRFDKRIYFDLPGPADRKRLLQFYLQRTSHPPLHLDQACRLTAGFSPAQIRNLVNVAARLAARRENKLLDHDCLLQAFDHIERAGLAPQHLAGNDRWRLALHHAAHLLTTLESPELRLLSASILPATKTLGHTRLAGRGDNPTQPGGPELIARIDTMLSAHVLERLLFGTQGLTTGCGKDLPSASRLARKYLLSSGTAPTTPLIRKDAKELSPHARDELDRATDQLLRHRALSVAQSLSLSLRRVIALACLLYQHETLTPANLHDNAVG